MRKIAIVGGGQSGLQLALGLLKNNYEVTVVSDRTAEQIFNGRVTSSQFMFHDALQNERDLGINFWERECPLTEGLAFTIPGPDETKALFWEAKLDHHGQSVDQRVKFAGWMNEFAKRGGDLAIKNAGPADIDEYSKTHDLVIVAAGKREVNRMFDRDAKKSPYDQPKRVLALTYVKKMEPRTPFTAVSFNLIPGVGEYLSSRTDHDRPVRNHGIRGRSGRADGLLERREDAAGAPDQEQVDPGEFHTAGGGALQERGSDG